MDCLVMIIYDLTCGNTGLHSFGDSGNFSDFRCIVPFKRSVRPLALG